MGGSPALQPTWCGSSDKGGVRPRSGGGAQDPQSDRLGQGWDIESSVVVNGPR